MARLLHDRYFEYAPARVCDLATGEDVAAADAEPPRPAADRSLGAFAEVLEHGTDGRPRWIAADVRGNAAAAAVVAAVADESCRRGYIPIAVETYTRLRVVLADELRDRALVLIARPQTPASVSRAALVDAAARSSRPHVMMDLRVPRAAERRTDLVREARAAYRARPVRQPVVPEDVARQLQRAERAAEFVRAGRHAAAERLLRDVIGALGRRRASAEAAATHITLGRLLLERGRAASADVIFGEAAGLAEAGQQEPLAATCRIWQAAARTDAAKLTAAESLCRAILINTSLDPDTHARAEAALARILLWQRRGDEARRLGFVGLRVVPGSDAYVHALAVRVLLESGDLFAAGQRARDLLTLSPASGDALTRLIALAAHVRVVLTTGDLAIAEEGVEELRAAARAARAPLRAARVSLLLVDAYRRAGRDRDATAVLRMLDRLRPAAPAILRDAIERRLRGGLPSNGLAPLVAVAAPLATAMITTAQREQGDREAIVRLCDQAGAALQCSRLDLSSADAGPVTAILSTGNGLSTRIGGRVLESGIVIGPEPGDPREIGVPVRLGERVLAALVARWPADVIPRPDAAEVLQLTAAVAAPRVESFLSASRAEARAATAIPELVGVSGVMAEVRSAVARAAASPFAVLIAGESGVGKELVARAIHHLSPRRERRFCDVNCAALPDDLLESELFGHTKGAFTGAITERAGLVEEADGGTLFLDEVLDLSLRAQAKLLRVVQQQELRRVGETFSRKVDVRFVSAANRDIRAEAAAGRFRQDLLYRLDVIRIHLPPLRERPEDIPLLAEHFWRAASARVGSSATLGHGVLAALSRYCWPGNVRELQNVIAALAVAAPARGQVRPAQLPAVVTGATAVTAGRLAEARAQFERRFLDMALARAGGSRSQAAREIGLSRQGLLKLMARLGMS